VCSGYALDFGVDNSGVNSEDGVGFWVLSQMSVRLFSDCGVKSLKPIPFKGLGFSVTGCT